LGYFHIFAPLRGHVVYKIVGEETSFSRGFSTTGYPPFGNLGKKIGARFNPNFLYRGILSPRFPVRKFEGQHGDSSFFKTLGKIGEYSGSGKIAPNHRGGHTGAKSGHISWGPHKFLFFKSPPSLV